MASTSFDHLPPAVQAAIRSDRTIDITTIGRRTGQQRRIEIWFLHVAGHVYITGTPGPRSWFANLLAEPAFTFHLKESVEADLPATAALVDDQDERRRVIESDEAAWYRDRASVEEFVASAPMVRIRFD